MLPVIFKFSILTGLLVFTFLVIVSRGFAVSGWAKVKAVEVVVSFHDSALLVISSEPVFIGVCLDALRTILATGFLHQGCMRLSGD